MENNRISEGDCLVAITASLHKGEGFRHLWVGYTGFGKTVANSILCQYLRDFSKMVVIVVDQKNKRCIYDGTQVVGNDDISKVKDRAVIIRGAAITKKATDIAVFDSIARDVWAIAQNTDTMICLSPDELMDAATNGQAWKSPLLERRYYSDTQKRIVTERYKDPWMDKLYRQGRVMGISVPAATQLVSEVPPSVLGMSETKGIFRQRGRELAYLERLGVIEKKSSEIVANLEIGEFLFTKQGQNDMVCKFDYDGS